MSKHRKRRSKQRSSSNPFSVKKKRSGLRTVIETVMGISIGLVIIAFVIWYYLLREETKELADARMSGSALAGAAIKDNVVDDKESYEAIRDSGNLNDLLHMLSQLDNWPRGAETPVRIDTLSKRLEIAQTILKLEGLDENQRVATAKTVINAMGQIYGISVEENLDADGTIISDYLNICNSFLADSNEDVAREALVGKVKAMVYESTEGDEAALDTINENFQQLISNYPDNPVVMSTMRLLLNRVRSTDIETGKKVTKFVVDEFEKQNVSDPNVLQQIRLMKDEIILADSGISELANVSADDQTLEKYLEKLGELSDIPDTSIEVVNRIYTAVSHFESKGQHDTAIAILERLAVTAANRTDPVANLQALRVCKFGLIRNRAVGTPFDFSDIDTKGEPVDAEKFSNQPVLLVFYSPNNPLASTLFQGLSETYKLISRTGLKVITIAVEPTENKLDFNFNPEWVNVSNGRYPDGRVMAKSEIFKRCPVTHVPYFALIDPNGVVDSINVPESYIKTRVEKMVAFGKKENQESTNETEPVNADGVDSDEVGE